MSMTNAEAQAVNDLLRFFLNTPRPGVGYVPAPKAKKAAAYLAGRATGR